MFASPEMVEVEAPGQAHQVAAVQHQVRKVILK